jgi:hypothetical protein
MSAGLAGEFAEPPGGGGGLRCPQLRCDRRGSEGAYCEVFLEPMVATPWELAVVMGEPGAQREEAVARCLREARRPVVTVGDEERPLRAYGEYGVGGGGTIVAELAGEVERSFEVIGRLLAAGAAVLVVTVYRLPGVRARFSGRAVHTIGYGRPLPVDADGYESQPVGGRPRGEPLPQGEPPEEQPPRGELPGDERPGDRAPWAEPGTGGQYRDIPIGAPPVGRFVNVAVADGAGRQVSGAVPAGLPYLIQVGIGGRRAESILGGSSPAFPERFLSPADDGWWLQAVLSREGGPVAEGALFLPRTGDGFACGCTPGERHVCTEGDRAPWLDLAVLAPRAAGAEQLQLALYFGVAAVQAFEIDVAVGARGPAPSGRVVFTLSRDLAELDRFGGRAVSIRLGDLRAGRHYVVVNGAEGASVGSSIADAQAGEAARSLRAVLFDRQLTDASGRWESRYDADFGKSPGDFEADLRAMAQEGVRAYLAMFPNVGDRDALAAALAGGAGPAVVQVAQAEGSRAVVPWQLVYDLPILDGAPACRSVREFGPGSAAAVVPGRCPYADGHDPALGTLCPFGFWGLAHVLEVPPSGGELTLAERTGADRPPTVVVALNETLAGRDWDGQRAVLDRLGTASVVTTSVAALRGAVAAGADLLYVFCHGRRVTGAGSAAGGLALDFGPGGMLTPEDVSFWASLSPRIRWVRRRPLVVLNGCYTGERLPETLTDFASAFVQSTGAAGVLATEVTMEQRLAAYSMSAFVTAWGAGRGVGEALREVRWQLLAKGNVMGLAYSPYCDADLRLP